MPTTRRSFIEIGSLAACGTALNAPSLRAATAALPGGLPLFENDQAVLAFVRTYSANFRITGASVLGRIRTSGLRALHVLAETPDVARLKSALAAPPFQGIHATGTTLSFALPDVDATIENLPSAAFLARLIAMRRFAGTAFAHDGLACDPQTGQVSDPFAARTGAVKMVDRSFTGPAALDVALRGTLEAAQLGLPEGNDFAVWKRGVLGAAAPAADARKLAAIFLRQLASLAGKLPAATVTALVCSRLISTALAQACEIDAAGDIAAFKELRAKIGGQVSNAAVWLLALIGPEIETDARNGAATIWLMDGTRFQFIRSTAALAQARTVLGV